LHKTRYNALRLDLELVCAGPLLVKAGGFSPDPALPDMQFVRTYHPQKGEVPYIPGSSLKGVVRSFVEKALRTYAREDNWRWSCPTFPDDENSCARKLEKMVKEKSSSAIYRDSCGACRLFGHTRLKGRAAFSDLLPVGEIKTEIRHGVAVSRLSHSSLNPFNMEVVVEGTFEGMVVLENYEIWQLGLLASAFGAINQGLLRIGFGKNRGFGRVRTAVKRCLVEEVAVGGKKAEEGDLHGLAFFVNEEDKVSYGLGTPEALSGLPAPVEKQELGFYRLRAYDVAGWEAIAGLAVKALA
jgi:CRISPR-associated RAMP protein (TIGR02581 family)